MDLTKCQIFTPDSIVKFMLDTVGCINIFDKKIIDNSCGNGQFLVEILRRFIDDGICRKITKEQIKLKIEECIYGYEIDVDKHKECIDNLDKIALEYNIKEVQWNIHCFDGLKIGLEEEFDFVVGNPPYIAYKDLDKNIRDETKMAFVSCNKGKFDYSYAFIEKGLNLLKTNGKMVMISPANMFKTVHGAQLREIIKSHLIGIIDCKNEKIFHKVLTSPAITIYNKDSNLSFIKYQPGLKSDEQTVAKDKLKDKWVFAEIHRGVKRFGDYFRVANSIATLSNKVFIHDVDVNGNVEINGALLEKEILKIVKSPRSEKYCTSQKIIFPYEYKEGRIERIEEDDLKNRFPIAYEYLKGNITILSKRDSDTNAKWYEFGRSQALAHLNQEKLMMSSIVTNRVVVYQLSKDEIPYSGVYIVPISNKTLNDAKCILESEDFYKYLSAIGISLSGNSIRISSKDIENYSFEE